MALRRQGLSQRRRAVGLTQESLAEQLGVERSTIVRWEAGDTEPLPSIRPDMARALQVSIDQLAELLTVSQDAGRIQALSAGTEATIPMLLPEVQSKVRPGRAELENLIPEVAETVEALRRRLRSPAVVPEDLDATVTDVGPGMAVLTPVGATGFAGSDVAEPAQTEVPHRPSRTAVPLEVGPAEVQRRRARSRWFKPCAAAGLLVLVFAGGAASAPFITSHSWPIAPATDGSPAPASPVAADPAPNPGNADSTTAVPMAPAAPNGSADEPAPPQAAAVPTTRGDNRTTSRPKPRAAKPAPAQPRTPEIPPEIAEWAHKLRSARMSNTERTFDLELYRSRD